MKRTPQETPQFIRPIFKQIKKYVAILSTKERVPFFKDNVMRLSKPCVSSGLGKALEKKVLAFFKKQGTNGKRFLLHQMFS